MEKVINQTSQDEIKKERKRILEGMIDFLTWKPKKVNCLVYEEKKEKEIQKTSHQYLSDVLLQKWDNLFSFYNNQTEELITLNNLKKKLEEIKVSEKRIKSKREALKICNELWQKD